MTKVLVSLNDKLLRQIDREAKSRRLSRSAYIAQLAESDIGRSSSAAKRIHALALLDRLAAHAPNIVEYDSTDAIREERDARR